MLNNVKMVIIDVDGVLTDGKIILDANGIESKAFMYKMVPPLHIYTVQA